VEEVVDPVVALGDSLLEVIRAAKATITPAMNRLDVEFLVNGEFSKLIRPFTTARPIEL
jgi:hypothetical protein